MKWFVYYLYSQKRNIFYIGKTNNLARRIKEHNNGNELFTKTGTPWKLIAYIELNNSVESSRMETKLKKTKNKKYQEWFFTKYGKTV